MARYFTDYPTHVSADERRRKAKRESDRRAREGAVLAPVEITGRKIAQTFWGAAWCDHLEGHSDYATRLPRGRSYVRNGSVIDLQIAKGRVTALVQGSELYEVTVTIAPLPQERWAQIVAASAGKIDSLIELLQGKLSRAVMEVVTARDTGLFPGPREITMRCSCPDHATMCKHVAAVLYGVGARLDESPELLFVLREVDHLALIEGAAGGRVPGSATTGGSARRTIARSDLADVFGIDLDTSEAPRRSARRKPSEKP